jgi:branched-chain amino acid transport system ATP-binding protein
MSSTTGSQALALETRALVKRFGGLLATDHVSLKLAQGQVLALIGPNGAGKTTLIGQLCGELRPDSGQVFLNGIEVTKLPVEQRSHAGLGRSYQISQVFKEFSARDNVVMALLARGAMGSAFGAWTALNTDFKARDQAQAILEQVGLGSKASSLVGVMAHGEHRQLELAMALALQPKVLLLDEPLAGMSASESDTMVELLQELRNSYPILLVEHDMKAVFSLADHIAVLVYGKVIAHDVPANISDNADVRAAYLGDEDVH